MGEWVGPGELWQQQERDGTITETDVDHHAVRPAAYDFAGHGVPFGDLRT